MNVEHAHVLPPDRLQFKTTIEPKLDFFRIIFAKIIFSKPRVCINARPLSATAKEIPCQLDRVESIIPYLTAHSKGIITDDNSGFMHTYMTLESQALLGIHFGDLKYHFQVRSLFYVKKYQFFS